MHYYRHPIDPSKFKKAYEMRHNPTPAEERMWEILKSQVIPNFPNHIFRRQYVAYGYILDFYCPTLRLGLEIDGDVHDDMHQREYDRERDSNLARYGIKMLRTRNDACMHAFRRTVGENRFGDFKFCLRCGRRIPRVPAFCPLCGEQQNTQS
jgi:very-short-patch-repair endonuclease